MRQTHLNEGDRELKARLRALLKDTRVQIKSLKELDLSGIAEAFPDLPKAGHQTTDNGVYRWPVVTCRDLVGIAICERILRESSSDGLAAFRLQNERSHEGSRALYRRLIESDYWDFTAAVGISEKVRKDTAIDFGIGTCFVWPKKKAQFAYITRSPVVIQECPEKGCLGVGGIFIVRAPADGTPHVEHGHAFYMMPDGRIIPRGDWKGSFATNDREFVILYQVTFPDRHEYRGLIAVQRAQDEVAIDMRQSNLRIRGTRAYRGTYHSFQVAGRSGTGEFYCEELDRTLDRERDFKQLLEKAQPELLAQLLQPLGAVD